MSVLTLYHGSQKIIEKPIFGIGSLGLQIVLKSEKAFSKIGFVKSEKADKNIFFPKYKERDTNARKSYLEGLRKVKPNEAIYLIDILRNRELLNELSL